MTPEEVEREEREESFLNDLETNIIEGGLKGKIDLISEGALKYLDLNDVIYIAANCIVYGETISGVRSVDHNTLRMNIYTLDEVLSFGIIVIPEKKGYLSKSKELKDNELGITQILNDLGYSDYSDD